MLTEAYYKFLKNTTSSVKGQILLRVLSEKFKTIPGLNLNVLHEFFFKATDSIVKDGMKKPDKIVIF